MNIKFWTKAFWKGSGLDSTNGIQIVGTEYTQTDGEFNVNFDSAMQLSAWWAGISKWVDVVASLPLVFSKYENDKWIKDEESNLSILFKNRVNRYQTKTEFFATFMLNARNYGNSINYVKRNKQGKIISIMPLSTNQVEISVLDDGSIVYTHKTNDKLVIIPSDEIWHFKTKGSPTVGLSPLAHASTSISIGLSADSRANNIVKNAAKPSGILTYVSDRPLSPKQHEQLQEKFGKLKQGSENVLMTLESGWKYEQIGLTAADIQLLESRRYQLEDIGRFLDIPSVLLNDTINSTVWGTGISEVINGWYKLSLRPMTKAIAESMLINLYSLKDRKKTRIEFDFNDLLKHSADEIATTQQKQINAGIKTPNECRIENRDEPLPGGDKLLINSALISVEQVGEKNDIQKP